MAKVHYELKPGFTKLGFQWGADHLEIGPEGTDVDPTDTSLLAELDSQSHAIARVDKKATAAAAAKEAASS